MVAPAGRRHYLAPWKKCGGLERRLQQGLRPHCASPAHDQVLIASLQFPASVRVPALGRLPLRAELIICQWLQEVADTAWLAAAAKFSNALP
jgi:hypothetical protein